MRSVKHIGLMGIVPLVFALAFTGCDILFPPEADEPAAIVVPKGFEVEKVADGLNLATSITWDDEGNMYVAEAGGGLLTEQRGTLAQLSA